MEQFDLAILGAGPGGYVAAIRAAQLGLKTVLIERDLVGGTCLNWGCIPTKCWADIAHTIEKAKKASGQGVIFGPPQVDINQLAGWKDKVVTNLRNGIGYLLKNHGVNLVISEGALTPDGSIKTKDGRGNTLVPQIRPARSVGVAGRSPVVPSRPSWPPSTREGAGAATCLDPTPSSRPRVAGSGTSPGRPSGSG